MPIEERAKRFLASFSKHGGTRRAASYRKLGELEQCKIAGDVLGETLKPDSSGRYYFQCPGIQFHTNKSGRRDCRFTPGDGFNKRTSAPTVHCLHESCGSVIAEINHRIRSECGKASVEYITDHGTTLRNAAAALVIGFDLPPEKTRVLLSEWNRTCTPSATQLELGEAIAHAQKHYSKQPDEVGYLLKTAKAVSTGESRLVPAAPTTPQVIESSFASAANLGKAEQCETPLSAQPIYVGKRGRLAREVRRLIHVWSEDGHTPAVVLLGPDEISNAPPTLCGLPVRPMAQPGISLGDTFTDG